MPANTRCGGESVTIRNARPADIPAITALEAACFPADPWPERFFVQALDGVLAAVEGQTLIGYAVLSSVLDEGSLDNIAVSPEYRRRGTADALVAAAEDWGRARELAFITLEVRAGNEPAIALYKKHGFASVGRRTNYYEKPREDAILMTLVLQT